MTDTPRRTIAVVGGTGTLGSRVVAVLRERGHQVRVLSRRSPEYRVDLTTGEGLGAALHGCDVVVDAANAATPSPKRARETLVHGSRRLLATAAEAGVGHYVGVSIVGCDRVPLGYYRVKTEQERVAEQGPVAWSIVRATQFHELIAGLYGAAGRWRVLPVPRARLQPVAAADAARAVAVVAEGEPLRRRIEVAGPEVRELRDLARLCRSAAKRRALLLPMPLPGALGRALRAGGLIAERPDVRGEETFTAWLGGGRGRGQP